MPFVDGEPIDAAKLSELETAFNVLKAQVPQFGTGATAVTGSGVGNSGAATTVVPYKIIARASGTAYSLTAGNSNVNQIKFPDGSAVAIPMLMSLRLIMVVPETETLIIGKSLMAFTIASIKIGV